MSEDGTTKDLPGEDRVKQAHDQTEQIDAQINRNIQPVHSIPDWFLQELVLWANADAFPIPITLSVSGMLITGMMISGERYFKEFSGVFTNQINAYVKPETLTAIQEAFRKYAQVYKQDPAPTAAVLGPMYIHLMNAQAFLSDGRPIPTWESMLWRGRVDTVDGFWVGRIEEAKGPKGA